MAEKIPGSQQMPEQGTPDRTQGSGVGRGPAQGGDASRQAGDRGGTSFPGGEQIEGRFYAAARSRGGEGDERAPGDRGRDQAPGSSQPWEDRAQRDARFYREPAFEEDPARREDARFEHGRVGFRDYGTPSYSQGRELRERYDDRDFAGRDDRYAGRSGLSYQPDELSEEGSRWWLSRGSQPSSRTWRTPEEEWERVHYRGPPPPRHPPRLWEREPLQARDIMTPNPHSVRPHDTLKHVGEILRDENCGMVPVVNEENQLVGLITERDMVMGTIDSGRPWQQLRAEDVMSEDIECVTPEESVHDVIKLMARKHIRRVPVVDRADRLLGMISLADIANRADHDEELQHALARISRRRSFWSRLWS